MNALLLLRSRRVAIPALGVASSGALALTALRFNLPGALPVAELLLFGALGVAIGRILVGAKSDKAARKRHGSPSKRSRRSIGCCARSQS